MEHSIWYLADSFGIKVCESGVNLVGNMAGEGSLERALSSEKTCLHLHTLTPNKEYDLISLFP